MGATPADGHHTSLDTAARALPRFASAALAALLAAGTGGCRQASGPVIGDAPHGAEIIAAYHCGACHAIPGVVGAHGLVGPPLSGFASRSFIAGQIPNTPANLVRWVRDPRSVAPDTAMPELGLGEQEARDVAAYLYELR
jgi:cytochrome c2